MKEIEIIKHKQTIEDRGINIYLDKDIIEFVGNIEEIHIASILPQKTRGNHFHKVKNEVIIVYNFAEFTFAWQKVNEPNSIIIKKFDSKEDMVVCFKIPPNIIHAIKNSGTIELSIITFSNIQFNADSNDTLKKIILG